MGTASRESFNVNKRYRHVYYIADRDAQDYSLNEMQRILDLERERLAASVWKAAGIAAGLAHSFPDTGEITLADGAVHLFGRIEPIAGAALVYDPLKVTGTDTVFVRWLLDQVTISQDPALNNVFTGDPVEERYRIVPTLVTTSPDALDEQFEIWAGTVPADWTLFSGASAKGYPARWGSTAVALVHTTGTDTELSRDLALTPGQQYRLYISVRTAPGAADLSIGAGAFAGFRRTSPAWNPSPLLFATTSIYIRHTQTVTADANSEPVQLRLVIPAGAPSTTVLIDAVLVTQSALGALDLDRHHLPLLYWDRATDVITRAVARPSALRMQDLEPPLSGLDIIDIEQNPGLIDFQAGTTYDEHGHFRVPPGLSVSRDTSLDTGSVLGLLVDPGRAYVRGYRVDKPLATDLTVARATVTDSVADEGHTADETALLRYALNKALGADGFPIASIDAVTAIIEVVIQMTRGGTPGGVDDLGVTNVVDILGVGGGTGAGATAATLVGTGTAGFIITETTNEFRVTVDDYDGSAGVEQELLFAPGTYTLVEILEAINATSGRAYRSGVITGNIIAANDGSGHVRLSTKVRSASQTILIGDGSANVELGFSDAATNTGAGVQWTETTQWIRSGNSIDWSPGVDTPGTDEPDLGGTYFVAVRRTAALTESADFVLAGLFPALQTYYYKVSARYLAKRGLPSAAVSRSTPPSSINAVSWTAVPNAAGYDVFRSTNGTNYYFLANVVGVAFVDDGAWAVDTGVEPATLSTTTNGVLAGGEGTVTVVSTAGFPASGSIFLQGSDVVTYTGITGTQFTGCAGVAAHASGVTVRQAPDMGMLTLAEDLLGIVNFAPGGVKPVLGTVFDVDYTYYLPRVDLVAVSRTGVIAVVAGVPADRPFPPLAPTGQLVLAQVNVAPNSTTVEIANSTTIDRPLTSDLRVAIERIQTLFRNDATQQILNTIANRDATTALKGVFADAMAQYPDGADVSHPDYLAFLDWIRQRTSVPFTQDLVAIAVDAGETTAVTLNDWTRLPSSEITLLGQNQWSEAWPVNPYDVFIAPPAQIRLTPDRFTWTVTRHLDSYADLSTMNQAIAIQQLATRLGIEAKVQVENGRPTVVIAWTEERGTEQQLRDAVAAVRATPPFYVTVNVRIDGRDYLSNEDNIAATFGGLAVALTPISPTVAGGDPNTVLADAAGRWAALFPVPSTLRVGNHRVRCAGDDSTADATFAGNVNIITPPPQPPPRIFWDPVAQSFYPTRPETVSAFSCYFAAKDTTLPITCQVRKMVGGFPGQEILAIVTLQPSEITLNAETRFTFPTYLTIDEPVAFCLFTTSTAYTVHTATLGKVGRNPATRITENPYPAGVFFDGSNGATWTAHQATDLRCRVYGRQFTSPAILEYGDENTFGDVTTVSDLYLGAEQEVPDDAAVAWEYELNGNAVVVPFGVFENQRLTLAGTSVLLRARLSTADTHVSPAIYRPSVLLYARENATTGKYISVAVDFGQDVVDARLYVVANLPGGTSATWYLSNDDGATWETVSTLTGYPAALGGGWSEYGFDNTFAASSGLSTLRVRCDLAGTLLLTPYIARIGVTVG